MYFCYGQRIHVFVEVILKIIRVIKSIKKENVQENSFFLIFDFFGCKKKCNLQIMLYANLVSNSNAAYFFLYYSYSSDLRFAFYPIVNY